MKSITLKARAKINISLEVIKKLDNGYHDLRMIMQTVNLYDTLVMQATDSDKVELTSNLSWLPTDNRNLVYKACQELKEQFNIKSGISVEINKVIPVGAGLAGGSTDCAAALVGMNRLFNLGLKRKDLIAIGKNFGADVPYCILRTTALAEGIGEKLTTLTDFPFCYVVLSKPNFSVATGEVFTKFDLNKVEVHPDTDKLIKYIDSGDLSGIGASMVNVLETVTQKKYPIIKQLKEIMLNNNALGTLMSGSGPTVFGLFASKEDAVLANRELKQVFPLNQTFLTKTFNPKNKNKSIGQNVKFTKV